MTNPSPLPRVGRRVSLRRLSSADLVDFQVYRQDERVGLFQDWSPWSDSDASAFLAEMSTAELFQPGEWFQIGIADRVTDALIGDIGLCVAPGGEEAEVGFTLRSESQGLGLGAEAVGEAIAFLFDHTPIARVVAITDARNLPAARLLERLGMQRLRTVKAVFCGAPCLEHVFALSRPEDGKKPLFDQ